MPLLAFLARLFLLRRLLGGRSSRRSSRAWYGRRPSRYGYARQRPRSRFGMFGPFPTYSRRTRGGANVSVGGCCLPIPLTLALTLSGLLRLIGRRRLAA
jgi:hypothetical protein